MTHGWVARELDAQLDELATTARAWREGRATERPTITVHLASGARHVGLVVDVVRETLTLESLPRRGSAEIDVTAIATNRIEALTIHGIRTVATPADTAATSMLDLKRRARALADRLTSQLGRPIAVEIGTGDLAILAPVFEGLAGALDSVLADELGRTSLAERVDIVRLTVDAGPDVSLADRTLVVSAVTRLDRERLRRELDALL